VIMTPEGYEVGFHGEYLEIVPDERIVCTEIFEGVPAEGNPAVNTMTFTEVNGRTSFSLLAEMGSQCETWCSSRAWRRECRPPGNFWKRWRFPSNRRRFLGVFAARAIAIS
jgi:hypothetical protein